LAVLKTKKGTLSKMWNMVCMVSTSAERAVGSWEPSEADRVEGLGAANAGAGAANVSGHGHVHVNANAMYVGPADNVLSVLCHDGPLGRLDCWLSLPWLAALLPHSSLDMCQNALMSFSMSLKIHEHEIAALSVLPDCRWLYHFLVIARAMHGHLQGEKSQSEQAQIADAYLVVEQEAKAKQSKGMEEEEEEKDTSAGETYAGVAQACLDVALDSLAQVIVYQTIHFGEAGRQSWQQLLSYVQLEGFREHEQDYLRQCVLYIFQKIARNHCGYNRYVLFILTKIVLLVDEKQLCGNSLERPAAGLGLGTYAAYDMRADSEEAEILLSPRPRQSLLSPQENKLLMFTIELSHKIRQGCEGCSLGNSSPEIKIILLFLRTFTGCLHRLPADAADAVCTEVEAIIVHSIDGWLLYASDYYRMFVIGLFDAFFLACRDPSVPSACREKYKQVIVSILHFYMAIRRLSEEDMKKHYPHVMGTIATLSVADDRYDANEIFALLNDKLAADHPVSRPSSRNSPLVPAPSPAPASDADGDVEEEEPTALSGLSISIVTAATAAAEEDEWIPASKSPKRSPATTAAAAVGKDSGAHSDSDNGSDDMLFVTELSSVEDESVHYDAVLEPEAGAAAGAVHSLDSIRAHSRLEEGGGGGEGAEQPFYFDLVSITPAASDVATSSAGLQRHKSSASSVDDLLLDYDDCSSNISSAVATRTGSPEPRAGTSSPAPAPAFAPALSPIMEEQEGKFESWRRISGGILADRIDTERARMERFHLSTDMTALATSEHWLKSCRKIETESFNRAGKEMWELAMRFEGQFPGRQRIVLLPWFLGDLEADRLRDAVKGAATGVSAGGRDREGGELSGGEGGEGGDNSLNTSDIPLDSIAKDDKDGNVREQLRGAYVGHDHFLVDRQASESPPEHSEGERQEDGSMLHGQSWNIVDMDDGEVGGYGVVGLARLDTDQSDTDNSSSNNTPSTTQDNITSGIGSSTIATTATTATTTTTTTTTKAVTSHPPATAAEPVPAADNQDSLLDLAVMAEGLQQGREVETAPCFSGTKKLSRDVHVVEVSDVSLLTAVGNFIGTMSFTTKEVFFATANDASLTHHLRDEAAITLDAAHKKVRRRRWHVDAITGIFMRSYRLRQSGLEVIFSRGKYRTFFIDFGSAKGDVLRRNSFAESLFKVAPKHAIKQHHDTSFHRLVTAHGIQEEWINGRVSNYDYLMYVNTLAGRSFNDLCQYPVMPVSSLFFAFLFLIPCYRHSTTYHNIYYLPYCYIYNILIIIIYYYYYSG
jgi:hypothetical protein